jgi:putative flippase GtrA
MPENLNGNPPKVNSGIIGEIIRFAVIGVINTGIDFVILNILIWATGIKEGNGLIPLNAISFTCAVINSYYMNKRWAFKDGSQGQNGRKFSVFLIVSIIGIVINTLVLRVVSTNIHPMFGLSQTLWTNVAKLLATGVSLVWNFIGYKLFVFKKQ